MGRMARVQNATQLLLGCDRGRTRKKLVKTSMRKKPVKFSRTAVPILRAGTPKACMDSTSKSAMVTDDGTRAKHCSRTALQPYIAAAVQRTALQPYNWANV